MQCSCLKGYDGYDCSMATCPNECSNNGICHNGTCYCNHQWKGPDCSVYVEPCPNNCSGNGICSKTLGKCECFDEYYGLSCEKWVYARGGPLADPCRNNCSGNGVCQFEVVGNTSVAVGCECPLNTVGPDCKTECQTGCNGHGRCIDGVCACENGWAGSGCRWKKCPMNCNDNGYCRDGVCLCKEGYTGDDCGRFTDEAMSYKCIKHCAPHCLKACALVFKASPSGDGAARAHDCYNKCTQPCLDECQQGGLLGAVDAGSLFGL